VEQIGDGPDEGYIMRLDYISATVLCATPDLFMSTTVYLGKPPAFGGIGSPLIAASANGIWISEWVFDFPTGNAQKTETAQTPIYLVFPYGETPPDLSIWYTVFGQYTGDQSWGGCTIGVSTAPLY
jgi:hypothetical protein